MSGAVPTVEEVDAHAAEHPLLSEALHPHDHAAALWLLVPREDLAEPPRIVALAVEGAPLGELRRVVYRVLPTVWLPLASDDGMRDARWTPLTREGLPVGYVEVRGEVPPPFAEDALVLAAVLA